MEHRVMSVNIPLPLAEQVDAMAEKLERSRGWIINQAIIDWLEEEERYHETLEALAEVEAGHGISDNVVRDWINSLGTDNPLPPPRP